MPARGPVSTRAGAALAGWTALVLATVVVLDAAGGGGLATPPLTSAGRWQAWLAEREPLVVAFAVIRLVALAVAWYLLATTIIGVILRAFRAGRLAELADRLTVPAVRRLLATTMSMSLVTTSLVTTGLGAVSAGAQGPGPDDLVPRDATTVVTAGAPTTEPAEPVPTITMHRLPDIEPGAGPAEPPPVVDPDPALDSPTSAPETWVVAPGQSLWSISEDVLARAWSRAPSEGQVAPYWRRLIEANRASLADPENPDLIFPGQVFAVPPPDSAAPGLAETM